MKSDRLLSIMLLLQTHGQLPSADLAERLEVSVRTIMRDVEALSAAGVPVYTVRGPQGGIALLPGYRTDITGLTADESRALFVLMSGSAHADLGLGQALGSALRKVMAALPAPYRPDADLTSRRILIDPARWRGAPGGDRPPPDLSALQRAAFTDRRLRVRYRRGSDNSVSACTLDPYGLVNKAGVWYLVADHRGEPRLFRADRVQSATVLSEPARRREGLELAEVWETLRRGIDDIPMPLAVTVRVRDGVLPMFLRVHQADLATGTEDPPDPEPPAGPRPAAAKGPKTPDAPGWTRVELRFRSLFGAQPLLAFGPDAEVLAPDELRRDLARKAAATAALYNARPAD
ncbi:helix-turn-helix transcriptional regulator [Actinacidiphila acididurans]|uniref:YafY family transcriptional regulator n=1 Tax=Actinacidiphila acididurans TaxID=2784346 RepID=A0ABS2TVT5_9ACTN|nr:YafY family protein [Actinacidiphila acididurans]MBM9506621.1 YafY family transcriptional regulator [Actinacidiphila acididurans]